MDDKCEMCSREITGDKYKATIGDCMDNMLEIEICKRCATLLVEQIKDWYL